jgi:hypothetical protein
MMPRRTSRNSEKGMALAIALFAMSTLLLAAASALLVGSADIRATRNYRGSSQVHFVAESGLQHALQVVNGPGVVNFKNEVVDQWGAVFGNGTRNFGPLAGFTYAVEVFQDAANPANAGRFRVTANGPEGVRNIVAALLTRSDIPATSPGAVYLAQDNATNANFIGNGFTIDGNDHNYTGGAGPKPPIPGISTRNAANTAEAIGSLGPGQADNVQGLGYLAGPPIVPSVLTSGWAPSVNQVNQIALDLLSRPHDTYPGGKMNGDPPPFGTPEAPRITYFSADTTIGNGNVSGAGIWIVEGDLTIQGSLEFKGLILVRGKTHVTGDTLVTGNATVYGSLWTNDLDFQVGGSAILNYSSQALALANLAGGPVSLPSPVQVTWLADCSQVAAGVGGCP